MSHGLPPEAVARLHGVLARHPAIDKALLYGSRARGTHKPGSDIDLTLCGASLTAAQLAAIAMEVDDLLLPYTVDLSILDQIDHADLRQVIAREGVVFYERGRGEEMGIVDKVDEMRGMVG